MRDKRGRGVRRGVATIELAMMAPVLTFVLLATVDFGRLFHGYITITACARNGAIYASGNSAVQAQYPYYNADIHTATQNAAQADAGSLSPLPDVPTGWPKYSTTAAGDASGNYTGTSATNNSYVEVKVHWQFKTIITYQGIPDTMDLYRTVRMRLIP